MSPLSTIPRLIKNFLSTQRNSVPDEDLFLAQKI